MLTNDAQPALSARSGGARRLPRTLCGIAQQRTSRILGAAALAGAVTLLAAGSAAPQPRPLEMPAVPGVWIDDTGQGAVEIATCGDRLCGRIVWLKEAIDRTGRPIVDANNPDPARRMRPVCGLPVIGNLMRQRDGSWDQGWIYDPKVGKSYDVELRLNAPDRLRVTGYIGVKFLSETFIWTRAPAQLDRCRIAGQTL